MDFSPKNPTRIPNSIEYQAEINDNPLKNWTSYSVATLSPELSKLEFEMFQTIYLMINELWNKIYLKDYTHKENAFAEWLYRKQAELVYNFLADKNDDTFKKFKQNIVNNYDKYLESKGQNSNQLNSSSAPNDIKEIINAALDSISDVRKSIVKHANESINSIYQAFVKSYSNQPSGTYQLSSAYDDEAKEKNSTLSGLLELDASENE